MGNFSLKAWTGGVGLAWLTVGLVRGRWGNTPPGAHNSGTPVSIACSPDSGFAHTGHGSLHVDFKANTEAWRSFRGGRPAANSMHRPRGCGEEAHPPTLDHHSLRCQLTPRPGRRGIPWCIQWGPTRAIATSFCALPFVRQKGGCVQCASPRPTVGSGVARVGPDLSRWLFSSLLTGDSGPP